MSLNQQFMIKAKQQLSGMWISAVLATLIYLALLSVASCTYVAQLIIVGPLTLGYYLFIIALTGYKKADYNTLFDGFKNFGQTLVAGLLISLATAVGFALLIVPGVILSLGFAMTYFIMIDDPKISGIDAMQASWNMMKGHKTELFCLYCRFIGWLLLCVLTCGILTLWIQPYLTAATLNFYRNLRYGQY